MPAAFTTAVLLCLLLVAVTTDLRSRRIPNTLVLTGMLLALAATAAFLRDGCQLLPLLMKGRHQLGVLPLHLCVCVAC